VICFNRDRGLAGETESALRNGRSEIIIELHPVLLTPA
jgi:hypothetical protein